MNQDRLRFSGLLMALLLWPESDRMEAAAHAILLVASFRFERRHGMEVRKIDIVSAAWRNNAKCENNVENRTIKGLLGRVSFSFL